MAFPRGISVPGWQLSINGRDFYEVEFDQVCETGLWQQLAAIFWGQCQMGDLVGYSLAQYGSIPIPCEWAIELRGGQQG